MQFFVHHNGQQVGPFSLEEVRAKLSGGMFQPTDLGWHEGFPEWQPLSSIPGLVGGAPTPGLPPPLYSSSPPPTSGLAVASLVLGILSFFTIGLTAIPAVICGHVSSSRIKKSHGRLTGGGLALSGLITGYIGFLFIFLGILAGIALPVFNAVQDRGLAVKSLAQAKQIGLGCKLYAGDHNGNFPASLDQLIPDYLSDNHLFVCPIDKTRAPMGYDYFGGKDTDPDSKILLASKALTSRRERIIVRVDCSGEVRRKE